MLDSYKETAYILPCLIQHESRRESTRTTGMKSIALRQGRFQESEQRISYPLPDEAKIQLIFWWYLDTVAAIHW